MHNCQKCRRPIVANVDDYTLYCDDCINAALTETDVRNARIDAGDFNVPNMTPEERERMSRVRREQLRQLPWQERRVA